MSDAKPIDAKPIDNKPTDNKPTTMANFEDLDRWLAGRRAVPLEVAPCPCEHCGTSGGCSVCGRLG